MKKTFKALAIAMACTLPVANHADIQHISTGMMLPELNQFLEDLRTEGLKNLEPLLEKIKKTRGVFQAEERQIFDDFSSNWYKELPTDHEEDKKRKKRTIEIFLSEHKENSEEPNTDHTLWLKEACQVADNVGNALRALPWEQSTITKIEYNENNEPISIEALHHSLFSCIERPLEERSNPFHSYIVEKLNPKETAERLNAFSRELSAGELKKRGIDIERLKELGIASVREMTFASVLESEFFKNKFTDEQRKKANVWFNSKDELDKAIETYAEAYPYVQKTVQVTFKQRYIAEEKKCDWDKKTFTWIDRIDEEPFKLSYLARKPKGTVSEDQKKIEAYLKNLLPYKNGKEKVILLLLLDEITPSEYRLKWMHDDGEHANGAYDLRGNAFYFSFEGKMKFLSHEIGHYLQAHLGLYQAFDAYQTPFAKQLLQLENKQTDESITIPSGIKDDIEFGNEPAFWGLKNFCFKCPAQLTAKKFFEYRQLVTRWNSTMEISNILGIYFKNNTLYLNALSDIRELKRIRYTHTYRPGKKRIECDKDDFKEESDKALFEKITEEAFGKPVPTETLGLLCLLHRRPFEDAQNAVCDFDLSNGWKEWEGKVKPLISNFIEDEQ